MSGVLPSHRRISCLALAVLLFAQAAQAASLFDPALRFQRLRTNHFDIYFHQGEAALAARLARIAEETWLALETPLGHPPPARTHVVLVDQTETSNGWATPVPYNTIVLTATWPAGSEFIGHTDDWLRLVFTHEFTHIVHLDRSRGWARLVKGVFGRVPVAFPNLFLPAWEVEGLATYFESAVTGQGRLHAQDFRAVEREPARRGRAFPLDRANGGLIAWPAGNAAYAYGLGFHQYLAERFGEETLGQVAERSAGRIPYTAARVFRGVYGQPLGTLWSDYQASLRKAAQEPPADPAQRLTHEGFFALGPRFAPQACAGCAEEIVYSVRTPHAFPALKAVPVSGGPPRTLATRYLGSTVAVTRDAVLFDQLELRRNVGLYADLYTLDRRTGAVRRLSTEARLLDPDLSPDGRTLAAVREHRGSRELVTVPVGDDGTLGEVVPILSEPGTQFATPRWSPDGQAIAAERHRLGEGSMVVVVDPRTKTAVIAATGATRAVTPAWRPDGGAIVAAIDTDDGPFNLFEFELGSGDGTRRRQLTHTTGGATWPDVSPDGATLVFVGYTEDGFDLFVQPYSTTAAAEPVRHEETARRIAEDTPSLAGSRAVARPYSPWNTLAPRAWMPLLTGDGDQVRAGLTTGGADVLGYHGYAASATWRVTGSEAAGRPDRREPDWDVSYALRSLAAPAVCERLPDDVVPDRRLGARQPAVDASRADDRSRRLPPVPPRAPGAAAPVLWAREQPHGDRDGVRRSVPACGGQNRLVDRHLAPVRLLHQPGGWCSCRRDWGNRGPPRGHPDRGDDAHRGRPRLRLRPASASRARASHRGWRLDRSARPRPHVPTGRWRAEPRRAQLRSRRLQPPARIRAGRLRGAANRRGQRRLPAAAAAHRARRRHVASVPADHPWRGLRSTRGTPGATPSAVATSRPQPASSSSADLVAGYALPFTLTAGVGRGRDGARGVHDGTTAYVRIGRAF